MLVNQVEQRTVWPSLERPFVEREGRRGGASMFELHVELEVLLAFSIQSWYWIDR
jgi:hypothetical protein